MERYLPSYRPLFGPVTRSGPLPRRSAALAKGRLCHSEPVFRSGAAAFAGKRPLTLRLPDGHRGRLARALRQQKVSARVARGRRQHQTCSGLPRLRRDSQPRRAPRCERPPSPPHPGRPQGRPTPGRADCLVSLREEGKKRKTPCAIGEDKGWQKNADHPLKWGRDESPDCSPQHF